MEYKLEDFLEIIGKNAQQLALQEVTIKNLNLEIERLKAELEAKKEGE